MSAFSLSDLLNPAPQSAPGSPKPLADTSMELDPPSTLAPDLYAPELFHNDNDTNAMTVAPSIFEQQGMTSIDSSSSPELMRKDSMSTDLLNDIHPLSRQNSTPSDEQRAGRRNRDPERLRDSKHTSKNEGVHTDRRYLCYICHKLFTRRRSVRDHLVKIHAEKTWEPQKSLEVIVHPHTGDPIESIEDIVARGAQTLLPKQGKVLKPRQESPVIAEAEVIADSGSVEEQEVTRISSIAETALANIAADIAAPEESVLELESPIPTMKQEIDIVKTEQSEDERPPSLQKRESSLAESRPSLEPPTSQSSISKKRPYPAPKKGTAKKTAISNKRPKLSESPARSPSATPAQRLGSKLKQSVFPSSPSSRASSRMPSASPSPSVAATPASSNDDGEVFCICRRGDNHSWMIACDGTCDDWYHGKCVGIKERDGELIDKYICPRCTRDDFLTTWKRMCRRKECRKPARVRDNPPSKYCSPECALKFMTTIIARSDPNVKASRDGTHVIAEQQPKRYRKKPRTDQTVRRGQRSGTDTPAYSDIGEGGSEYETDSDAEQPLPSMGGSLSAGELKSLLIQLKSVENMRDLGQRPPTPPGADESHLRFDDYETQRLQEISERMDALTVRLGTWSQREKFLDLIVARSKTITDSVKATQPKLKKVCGYDRRCAWDEEQFRRWHTDSGSTTIMSGKVGPPEGDDALEENDDTPEEDRGKVAKGGVCIRNNCAKHGAWQKAQIAEIRFEQDRLKEVVGRLTRERQGIRERAAVRGWDTLSPVKIVEVEMTV